MSVKGSRIKVKRHDPGNQYRLLFESNPHPMWVYDLETLEFLTVNEAAIHRYGYSRDEFMGMTIKDIRPPEDIPDLLENISKVTEGLDDAGIWRHKKKDGSIIYVEIVSHTIDFNGRRAEMVLANDITKRMEAEEELRLKAQLLDRATDSIFVHDRDGNFLYMNEVAYKSRGYTRDELMGMNLHDIVVPEFSGHVDQRIEAVLENGEAVYESANFGKNGSIIPIEVHSCIFDSGGRKLILAVTRDITERKDAEKLQREKTIAELYGFIVSALPVFASNVPSLVRHSLISNFAQRFDKNIRPRFEKEIEHLPCGLNVEKSIKEGIPVKLDIFILWLGRMFENINIRTNTSYEKTDPEGIKANLEFLNCPWKGDAKANPIFCFICRTIVLRSFTWTKQNGSAQQKSSIANGSKTCRFEIQVKLKDTGII